MSPSVLLPYEPVSSGEIQTIDFDRIEEVERRHALLAEYLELRGYDGLLLRRPANFAWLTVGGDNTRGFGSETTCALYVSRDARVALANNVDSGQLFDRELSGLGFQLKERPWQESTEVLLQDLCRGRNVASDSGLFDVPNVDADLSAFRQNLSESDHHELKALGKAVAHAVEATARSFEPRQSEAEVAGHLAHRLLRHRIAPVRIQVHGDGQGYRYRHWSFGEDKIERHCVISVVGRRRGLHVGASRSVSFGPPPKEILDAHHVGALLLATGEFFTQSGWPVADTWARVQRIYEKFGAGDEWRLADQADVIGYEPSEFSFTPASTERIGSGAAVFWHPSVRTTAMGDTILVRDEGFELLTPMDNWPSVVVELKGRSLQCPAILCRDSGGSEWAIE